MPPESDVTPAPSDEHSDEHSDATPVAAAVRQAPGWRLERRLAAAVALLAVVLLTVAGIAAALLVQVRSEQTLIMRDYFKAVTVSDRSFLQVVDAETGIRGYALTGNPSMLEPLQQAQAQGRTNGSKNLRNLLHGDKDVLAALDKAGVAARRWFTEFGQPTITAVQKNGPQAVSAADIERGKALFDTVRADYNAYIDALLAKRNAAAQSLALEANLLFAAVIVAVVAMLAGAILLWVALRRWVTRPIAELASETRVVAGGELDHEVHVVGSPEFVELSRDVDGMRRYIVAKLAEVEASRAQLERAEAELRERAEDLQRSNRDLEQFAYVASHDLQEPLRKVASFCQLLERRYKGQLDERADQYIEFAVDGARRMQMLINDLLAFSRVGRLSAQVVEVDLEKAFEHALRNLGSAMEDSDATVTHDPLPAVWGDPSLLTALLQNLVGNGIKFRTEEAPRIHVGVERHGDVYEFTCSDNGIGISPQYADRIFVIFQRLHGRDEYGGTGIGLAMAKKIVEWHGGAIWLDPDSAEGKGTTFRWTLPVERRAEVAPEPVAAA